MNVFTIMGYTVIEDNSANRAFKLLSKKAIRANKKGYRFYI